jgi:hypothetical protein
MGREKEGIPSHQRRNSPSIVAAEGSERPRYGQIGEGDILPRVTADIPVCCYHCRLTAEVGRSHTGWSLLTAACPVVAVGEAPSGNRGGGAATKRQREEKGNRKDTWEPALKFPWSNPFHLSESTNCVSLLIGHSILQSFYRMGGQTTTQQGAALGAWSLGYNFQPVSK